MNHQSPPRPARPRWLPLLAAFLVGVMCGAAGLVPFTARRLQSQQIQQGILVQELVRYRGRLERLTRSQGQYEPAVIRSVDLELLGPEAKTSLQLQEALTPLLSSLEGRQLAAVAPYLVHSIFDDRLVEVEDGQFRLTVKYIVLGYETHIVLTVRPVEQIEPQQELPPIKSNETTLP